MERYDYLSYRIARKWLEKEKIATRFRKITNNIDDINELEEEINIIYRNFKFKNIAIIVLNLPILSASMDLISRTFGGGVSDINLMRKVSIKMLELRDKLGKINLKEDEAEKEFKKYKQELKKIHLKIKKLT